MIPQLDFRLGIGHRADGFPSPRLENMDQMENNLYIFCLLSAQNTSKNDRLPVCMSQGGEKQDNLAKLKT